MREGRGRGVAFLLPTSLWPRKEKGRTESSCSSLQATERRSKTEAKMEPMVGQGLPYDSREVGQPEGLSESSRSSLRATKRQGETGARVELMVGQGPPYGTSRRSKNEASVGLQWIKTSPTPTLRAAPAPGPAAPPLSPVLAARRERSPARYGRENGAAGACGEAPSRGG